MLVNSEHLFNKQIKPSTGEIEQYIGSGISLWRKTNRYMLKNYNFEPKLAYFTKKYGIEKHFKYGMGQYGICHTLSHEEALVLPGQVYVGGDSHTNTSGALGAFACGLGHTDVAYVLLNGQIWFKVPETIYFKINGTLSENVMARVPFA